MHPLYRINLTPSYVRMKETHPLWENIELSYRVYVSQSFSTLFNATPRWKAMYLLTDENITLNFSVVNRFRYGYKEAFNAMTPGECVICPYGGNRTVHRRAIRLESPSPFGARNWVA